MRIYGLDFTSAPTKRKPITCASCRFEADLLSLEHTEAFTSFDEFETFLTRDGPWLAAIDAPFGQPRALIDNLTWPQRWKDYVIHIGSLGKEGFVQTIRAYQEKRTVGQKEHKREVDIVAGAISPMKLSFVPVGKMFFQLAPRLAKTPINIPLLQPTDDSRVIVEAYPALITRPLGSYKNDNPKNQTSKHLEARRAIVKVLSSSSFQATYVRLELSSEQQSGLLQDPKADVLDAFLCAVQGAWAHSRRRKNYGIPARADRLEGWIADPTLA